MADSNTTRLLAGPGGRQDESAATRHLLQHLADDLGVQAALDLADWRGGIHLYVPAKIGADHPICQQLGREVADWLVEHCTGYIKIPAARTYWRALRDAELVERMNQGESGASLAQRYHLDVRSVWRIAAEQRGGTAPPTQGSLL